MITKQFSELGLSPEVLKAIARMGFEQASPIQAETIPVLMQGCDVVGQSQTGSGKTAAFAVPAIEKVNLAERGVQMLILCPTRELAIQVSEEVHKLAFFKRGIQALPIYGGQSYERQFQGLKQGAQIVIGTPGRVMDHMRRGTLRLSQVRMVVLDEADVMLDMGFREDIEFILQDTPATRQTVFFSATMPRPIQELIKKFARDPKSILIDQKTATVPTVEQIYYEVDRRYKIELLTRLIDLHDLKLGIIFCNTKRMVDDLVDHLNAQGYSADGLHGDMGQGMRDRVMQRFRKSGLEFLVATDVAARGIDVDDVQVVFNYDLPYDVEDYVHRIGRTGRAGREGVAISFVAGRELFQIQHIERYTHTRIRRAKPPTQAEVEEARANAFIDRVRATLLEGKYLRQDRLVECLLEEGHNSTDIASALLHLLQGGESAPIERAERAHRVEQGRPKADYESPQTRERRAAFTADRLARPSTPARSAAATPVATKPKTLTTPKTATRPAVVTPGKPTPAKPAAETLPPVAPPETAPTIAPDPLSNTAATPPQAASAPAGAASIPSAISPTESVAKPAGTSEPVLVESEASLAAGPAPSKLKTKSVARTPAEQVRLYMNVGIEMGVLESDVTAAIQGETGLPLTAIGKIDLRERHLFVNVDGAHARGIVAKLNRTQIKNHKLKVKVA
jgi:ATP-dependent RNA helicase DeaD